MTTIFSEGEGTLKLTFEFADKWQVYKYDEPIKENFYNKLRDQGLKAVDFIAVSEKIILLVEVKYVLAPDEASKLAFSPDRDKAELERIRNTLSDEDRNKIILSSKHPYIVDEVVKKARDTLLGLLASHRQSDKRLANYNKALLVGNKPVVLMLFLERNAGLNKLEFFKPMASNLKISIGQKINFLGNIQVLVVNTLTIPPELGIKVRAGS